MEGGEGEGGGRRMDGGGREEGREGGEREKRSRRKGNGRLSPIALHHELSVRRRRRLNEVVEVH